MALHGHSPGSMAGSLCFYWHLFLNLCQNLKAKLSPKLMKKWLFSEKSKENKKHIFFFFFLLLIFNYSPRSIALAVDSLPSSIDVATGSKDATFLLKISLITAPVTHKWWLYCTYSSPRLSSLSPLSYRRAFRSPHIISRPSRPSAGAHLSSRFLPPQSCCYLYDPLANAPLN